MQKIYKYKIYAIKNVIFRFIDYSESWHILYDDSFFLYSIQILKKET